MIIEEIGKNAKKAGLYLASLDAKKRDGALLKIAAFIEKNRGAIEDANRADLEAAAGLSAPLLKRTAFSGAKLSASAQGVRSVAALGDPIGRIIWSREIADGMKLEKVSVPIGVIGVVFEARPDALVQIAALALKSGNAVILKGGSEAARTNRALYETIVEACGEAGVDPGWITLLETRRDVAALLGLYGYVDLIIPRGSNEFVRYIMDNTKIPVMGHADGVCHCYIDRDADLKKAVDVVVDAKTQYPAVCNAAETLLWHKDAAKTLVAAAQALKERGVTLHGCAETAALLGCERFEGDYHREYLDLEMTVKMVGSLEEAIAHINAHGSGHTDAIVTENAAAAERFLNGVDSAGCYLNCSTRFADGFRYGFGAEVGVSTSKLHARGPVGLEGLTTYKYKLYGNGDRVEDFESGARKFR